MLACVRRSALAVFREIGTGATESVHQHALVTELRLTHKVELRMEHVFGLDYRGLQCGTARADLFIPSIPAVVGFEVGVPAYPDPSHDPQDQLILTTPLLNVSN